MQCIYFPPINKPSLDWDIQNRSWRTASTGRQVGAARLATVADAATGGELALSATAAPARTKKVETKK